MRFGSEYRIDRIRAAEFEAFAKDIGVKPRLVGELFEGIAGKASGAWETIGGLEELRPYSELVARIRAGWEESRRQLGW